MESFGLNGQSEPPAKPSDPQPSIPLGRIGWHGVVTVVAAFVGALMGWSGVNGRLDQHDRAIEAIKIESDHQGKQLDRIEDKLDILRKRAVNP